MSQAQRKSEESRVRSAPPPLPRRNHGGPAIASSVPSIKPKPRVSTPPPPPPEALRSSRAPRLSLSADSLAPVELALLPQWEDANASLRPAPKKSKGLLYWVGSATVSIAVGALVSASLMSIRAGDIAQILPSAHSETPRIAQPMAVMQAHVEVHEAELQPEIVAVAQPVLIDELTVTGVQRVKAVKPSRRVKPTARGTRRAQPVAMTSQPDPRDEAEAEGVSEVEPVGQPAALAATTVEATEAAPAAEVEVSAPEAPEVSEPEAPALPEKLSRDQVRAGLDAVRSQVLQCTNGTYGRVLADVTISGPGRVSHAVIEGTFAGTNAGSCMARAIRGAKFEPFSGPEISVRYPFSF